MKGSSNTGQTSSLPLGRHLAFTVIIIALSVVVLEAGLHLVYYVLHFGEPDVPDPKMLLSPYKDKAWARQYWTEMHQREIQYEPFYGWSYKEFHGQYVNIDSLGLRKTWNAPPGGAESAETLFVFGGSTIWGGGCRDDHSIPSVLSRLMNEKGFNIFVVNYGMTGYVFSQEVVRLMMALREGHRPDYVVFYDGANDVYSAYQSGVAGTFQNVSQTRKRLKRLNGLEHIMVGSKDLLSENSLIYRAVKKLIGVLSADSVPQEAAARDTEDELKKLAGDIRRAYTESRKLLDFLAQIYDFEYICFWQPVAFLETSLDQEEQCSDNRLNDKALAGLFKYANDSLADYPMARFFDLTDALADRPGTFYIDFCHICEEGNEWIAGRLFGLLAKQMLTNEPLGKD